MVSDLSRFFKHTSVYALGSALQRVGGFLLLPLYTTMLTTGEYGTLELFYSLAAIASAALAVGLAHATLRFYFEYDDAAEAKKVVSTTLIATLLVAVPGASLLALFAESIVAFFFDGAYELAVYIVLTTLVLELLKEIGYAYFRAREYSVRYVGVATTQLVVQVAVNLYTVGVLELGVEGVLFGNMLAVACGCAFVLLVTVRECGFGFDRAKFVAIVRYSYPFLINAINGTVLANADRFLIGYFFSLETLGVYALAMKFSQIVKILVSESLTLGFGSFRFSILKQDDAREILARIAVYMLAMVTFASLGVACLAPDVISIIATPEYAEAGRVIPILMVAVSIGILGYIMQTGILYEKQTGRLISINLTQGLVLLALNVALIPILGIYGAAIATVGATTFQLVYIFFVSQRLYYIPWPYARICGVLALGAATFGLSWLIELPALWQSLAANLGLVLLFAVGLFRLPILFGGELGIARALLSTRGNNVAHSQDGPGQQMAADAPRPQSR